MYMYMYPNQGFWNYWHRLDPQCLIELWTQVQHKRWVWPFPQQNAFPKHLYLSGTMLNGCCWFIQTSFAWMSWLSMNLHVSFHFLPLMNVIQLLVITLVFGKNTLPSINPTCPISIMFKGKYKNTKGIIFIKHSNASNPYSPTLYYQCQCVKSSQVSHKYNHTL